MSQHQAPEGKATAGQPAFELMDASPDEIEKLEAFHAAFKEAAKPLIQFLAERCHPHSSVIVTYDSAELVEADDIVRTSEFIRRD